MWEHDGMICTGEVYKEVVKLTFAQGAALPQDQLHAGKTIEHAAQARA